VKPGLPNEPYTPILSGLTLGYGASARFEPDDIHAHGRFYTLGAFGHTTGGPATPARLAPDHGERAELMIGLADFDTPGTVSVLFQLADGTASIADPPAPGDIGWSYLSGDDWVGLPPSAVAVDETRGFQTPGIVTVSVGHDATRIHTAMTPGLTWLRARLSKPAAVAARTERLYPQAATAEFVTDDPRGLQSFDKHLAAGLPAGAVTRLERSLPAIKSVIQPYASFGGRPADSDRVFFERSAERLRHRARGVSAWDFEHLVLERVDGVFKVRALPHRDAGGREAAGQVALVIIPNRFASQSANRLEPRAGETLMEEIRDVVETGIATPFARVNVIHPVFERMRVLARIAFRPGFDPGFYSSQLNEDLQRFLSPWAFEEGRDIVFGTHVYRSELLKFVEDRDYVDYVTRFDIYHAYDGPPLGGIGVMEIGFDFVIGSEPDPSIAAMTIGEDFIVGRPVEAAQSTRPDAVLVSHPKHIIEPVFPGTETCSGVSELGIGYMIVGLDFIVSRQ
jgi:hypothetical protein